ncbi:MAG TPA: hypothetical protein VKM55_04015 [Candidatus Lokiarchaeia archaeon]|nr:hypothetical protein [Candidatus Lokiarchaeia archaeon]
MPMVTIKELIAQRKSATKEEKTRVTISTVLVVFGFLLISTVLAILSLLGAGFPLSIFGTANLVLFVIFLVLVVKYKKEQKMIIGYEKVKSVSIKGTVAVVVILLVVIGFDFSFFNFLIKGDPLPKGLFILSMIILFGFLPFIMALWYKTSPAIAVKLIVRLYHVIFKRGKKATTLTLVMDTHQEHSFRVAIVRSMTAMIFTTFTIFTAILPVLNGLKFPTFPELFIKDPAFACASYLLVMVIGTVLSFVLFFWLLPPCFLLDDAGVVFFRQYQARRTPPQIQSISGWFMSIIRGIVGTSALFTYVYFVIDNWSVFGQISGSSGFGLFPATQFAIFIFGFPVIGTILMASIVLLFQESQFTKLKTFLYQELVNIGVDPRVVKIALDRKDAFQDKTLADYPGENFFINPKLTDAVEKFPPPGRVFDETTGSRGDFLDKGKQRKNSPDDQELLSWDHADEDR